ncbi:EAL domain-containing protein [Pseudomonas sediminis]|uniref:EAL domain-containing protein n=1 Tax=Pseudomonas sediminis TaxID=1691904 RepID=UPI0031CCCEA9
MAILALGKAMRMRVVGEGVETAEQLRFLKHHGCKAFQGYYYSVPTPTPAITYNEPEDAEPEVIAKT